MRRTSFNSPEHIGAFIIVINSKKKILLGLRKNAYKSGYWGLPGGRLEMKEKLTDCVKRELFEETGLVLRDCTYVTVVREFQIHYTFIHFGFVCSKWSGKVDNRETDKCEKWEWFSSSVLPSPLIPAHQKVLEAFINGTMSPYLDLIP